MNIKNDRTKEEKQALVKDFLASGKVRTVWCREENIPVTTFVGWMKVYAGTKKEVSFIPIHPKKKIGRDIPSTLLDSPVCSSILILEIGSCKIQVTESTPVPFLTKVLKVVNSIHV